MDIQKHTSKSTIKLKNNDEVDFTIDKSEDDDGSRAVFDDVDCFRSQG